MAKPMLLQMKTSETAYGVRVLPPIHWTGPIPSGSSEAVQQADSSGRG